MKIAVYTVCKNEEKNVEYWLDSVRHADYIVVADTGSTDGTVETLLSSPDGRHNLSVHQISVDPWRFDDARNASLALVPADADVCFVVDLDEQLSEGWREEIESKWVLGETTRADYLYVFNHKDDGTPDLTYRHNRIHSRHGYRWKYPTHEILVKDGRSGPELRISLDLECHQYQDKGKDRTFNLPLLEVAVREEPHDARLRHYLSREYYYMGLYDYAIESFKQYLDMPEAVWHVERSQSCRYLANALKFLSVYREDERQALLHESLEYFRHAVKEDPKSREAWVELAKAYYDQQNWQGCYAAAHEALEITERTGESFNESWAWDGTADDLKSFSAWQLGLKGPALRHARNALQLEPNNERLRKNVIWMTGVLKEEGYDAETLQEVEETEELSSH